jgi:HSP20 family protein
MSLWAAGGPAGRVAALAQGLPEEGAMRLMRWEPFREMDDLLQGFGPLFGRVPALARTAEGVTEFMPAADIVEREKEYLIKVDLPEVRKEDVKVLFDDGVLTIRGERKVEKEIKGEKMHRTERFYGTFERSFALPDDVDAKGIHAESKDGVLLVSLPRIAAEKRRPLAITIQ